jgi:hypothetical protein
MTLKLSPVDQFIAARVKVRFASLSRRAVDHTDLNDYPKALRVLKTVDPLLGGLKTTSDRYEDAAKKALVEFATSVDKIPTDLEKLGVSPKSIQRFHTQLVNLIKVARKGSAVRAYSTYISEAPLSKAKKVIVSLGNAALKSSGVGTKILKPALVGGYLSKNVMEPFASVVQACDSWYEVVGADVIRINSLLLDAHISPAPYSSGFTLTPEYEEYSKAQREFAKQNDNLLGTIRHNLIGLPSASSGFEDCTDVNLCLATMTKTFDETLKLHMAFGKEWGDFRAKNQAQESGQRSLFARAI